MDYATIDNRASVSAHISPRESHETVFDVCLRHRPVGLMHRCGLRSGGGYVSVSGQAGIYVRLTAERAEGPDRNPSRPHRQCALYIAGKQLRSADAKPYRDRDCADLQVRVPVAPPVLTSARRHPPPAPQPTTGAARRDHGAPASRLRRQRSRARPRTYRSRQRSLATENSDGECRRACAYTHATCTCCHSRQSQQAPAGCGGATRKLICAFGRGVCRLR